ncbi:MAG: tRNA 4-thiouridine(8) synthase ThiI [Candidatus Aenigmarchaeota archaeon]|nr:tRNA 4-thiouridine(8) synthase ThiI [Candidatus Aenigmarchaeota archaeon]
MATALLLFSEGLDSILAGLILKKQGINIIALKFVTPFFGFKDLEDPQAFHKKVEELGFERGFLIDITEEFLKILESPKYGFGSYANPCIDCKILMLKKAKELLSEIKADFLATGEVLKQRPISQNRWALEVIEKESKTQGILVRPLSAKLLAPSEPEIKGLINREELWELSGRKRQKQLELAKKLNLKEIPTPAGGCLLCDPQIGTRVLKILKEKRTLNCNTAKLLTLGRHFIERDYWLVLGRNQRENERLKKIAQGKYPLITLNVPSPLAVLLFPILVTN